MSAILKKATSPEILNDAWRKSKNDNAVWRPGIPRADMERRFVFHMLALADDLRSGAYRPDPVRSFVVNKGDGGTRTITALTLRDKVAQRAVLAVIEPLGERCFHPDSYAYRRSRNIDMVMTRIGGFLRRGYPWAVSADILQCFDSIPRKRLISATREMIPDDKVMRLIG
jgi:RNA-directed DNA polymerase